MNEASRFLGRSKSKKAWTIGGVRNSLDSSCVGSEVLADDGRWVSG